MWLKAKSALMLSACQDCGRDMKAYRAFTAPWTELVIGLIAADEVVLPEQCQTLTSISMPQRCF
jgi:hypothetical protein